MGVGGGRGRNSYEAARFQWENTMHTGRNQYILIIIITIDLGPGVGEEGSPLSPAPGKPDGDSSPSAPSLAPGECLINGPSRVSGQNVARVDNIRVRPT